MGALCYAQRALTLGLFPLGDVALCIRIAGMPIGHRSMSSRSLLIAKEVYENNVSL